MGSRSSREPEWPVRILFTHAYTVFLRREWPTIPQLYVNGEFVGGCDIMLGSGYRLRNDFQQTDATAQCINLESLRRSCRNTISFQRQTRNQLRRHS
jgi:hypothetical protein